MSTTKDGSKRIAAVPKERTATKSSSSKRESSTDRANAKKKKEPQEIHENPKHLTKISEEKDKPKKSSISTKVSSRRDKAPSTSSTKTLLNPSQKETAISVRKVSSKSEKESIISTRVSSKHEKESSKSSTKISPKPEKVSSTSSSKPSNRSTRDTTKSTSETKTSSKKGMNNHEAPSTPSSSRVQKTQYFPSKNLYSNALKYSDIPENVLEEIKSVRKEEKIGKSTKEDKGKKASSSMVIKAEPVESSRSVISVINHVKESLTQKSSSDTGRKSVGSTKPKLTVASTRDSSPDTSSMSERPRTATLRKGSIVNTNIVGPEAPQYHKELQVKDNLIVKEQPSTAKQKSPSPVNSDDNYEDDFESYESDFEAYSSSEDNTNLAKFSGEETSSVGTSSEDIPENDLSPPVILQTDNKKFTTAITDEEKTHDSGTFELPDFKHRRIIEHIKESVEKETAISEDAKIKEKANLSSLSDEGFEDQHSLQFINFANAQKKCEKRRISELRKKRGKEILGMIKLDNVSFTIFDTPAVPYEVFISSYGKNNTVQASAQTGDEDISEGVQTEAIKVQDKWTQLPITFSSLDQNQENFWINYKKEYMGVGDDELPENTSNEIEQINDKRLKTFLNQSVELISDILAEANIGNLNKLSKNQRDIPFSDGFLQFNTTNDIFKDSKVQNISIYEKNINHILTVHVKNEESVDFIRSIVSVWDLSDFNAPRTTLVSFGEVCCATFSSDVLEYIFAGQRDGAILVWNVKEKSKSYDIPSRTPTFTTNIGESHFARVISIQPLKYNKEQTGYFEEPENNEICSLDENGEIIVWNLYTDLQSKNSTSQIVLINTVRISLQELYPDMQDLLCSEFILLDRHVYISTNYGFILHCILNMNGRSVKKFVPATKIDATCLEACPFSSSFFLAGYSNGDITLYSRNTERPLMVLRNNEDIVNNTTQIIRWSKTKPFVMYAKDSKNTIHIWDLSKSDMYPEYSIHFNESISCLKLSPVLDIEQKDKSYALIGTGDGKIYLHLLNKEYGQEPFEVYRDNVATFLNYANRL